MYMYKNFLAPFVGLDHFSYITILQFMPPIIILMIELHYISTIIVIPHV